MPVKTISRAILGPPVVFLALSLAAIPQARAQCAPSPSGLVAWWQGEGNGFDVFFTNNAALMGNTTFTNGEVGQAFSFDGVGSWVQAPASVSLDLGSGPGFTIEAWIKPADVSGLYPLVEWDTGGGGTGVQFGIGAAGNGSGSLAAYLLDTQGNPYSISSDAGLLVTGQWQHVAFTYDQSSGVAALF